MRQGRRRLAVYVAASLALVGLLGGTVWFAASSDAWPGPGPVQVDVSGGDRPTVTAARLACDRLTGMVLTSSGGVPRFRDALRHPTGDLSVLLLGDSTANDLGEWYHLLAQELGRRFPAWTVRYRPWNDRDHVYEPPLTVSRGDGPHVLTLWNGSIGGARSHRAQSPYFDRMVVAPSPDLLLVSYGHNHTEGTVANFRGSVLSLVEDARLAHPGAAVALIGQNPGAATLPPQRDRAAAAAEIAAERGYGFVDVLHAYVDHPDYVTGLLADSTHPNGAGSRLWADLVLAELLREGPPAVLPPSSLSVPVDNLLANGDFAAWSADTPDHWVRTGTEVAGITKDLDHHETGGQAVEVAGPGTLSQMLDMETVTDLRGKTVTLAVRLRRDPSEPQVAGRVSITDGVASSTSEYTPADRSRFVWVTLTHHVSPDAKRLQVNLHGGIVGSPGVAGFDRAVLATGGLPHDIVDTRTPDWWRDLEDLEPQMTRDGGAAVRRASVELRRAAVDGEAARFREALAGMREACGTTG